jgi:hypothetical protein
MHYILRGLSFRRFFCADHPFPFLFSECSAFDFSFYNIGS